MLDLFLSVIKMRIACIDSDMRPNVVFATYALQILA